jgi:hypothetical protein
MERIFCALFQEEQNDILLPLQRAPLECAKALEPDFGARNISLK